MTALVPAQCPNCGASVDLDPTATQAVCRFCNTTSRVQDPRRDPRSDPLGPRVFVLQYPVYPVPARPIRSSGGLGPLVAFGAIAVVGAAVVGAIYFYGSVRSPPPARTPTMRVEEARPSEVQRVKPNLSQSGRPLVHDVDGDGVKDVILWINGSFSAFSGKDGAELWSAPSKGARHQAFAFISGHDLVEVSGVSAAIIDLGKGALKGEVTLEDKAQMPCDRGPAFAGILLADDDVAKIDLASRKVSIEKKGACREAESDLARRPDLVARKYLPPDEVSAAVDAVACGGVNVTGTYNYVLPDPCGPKGGPQMRSLGDFEPRLLVSTRSGFLVLGHKAKGMKYPVGARIDQQKVRWNNTFSSAPKTSEGSLSPVALSTDSFAGIFSVDGKPHLFSANVESGIPDFDVALDEPVRFIAPATGGWFLVGSDYVDHADAKTGKTRRLLGWK